MLLSILACIITLRLRVFNKNLLKNTDATSLYFLHKNLINKTIQIGSYYYLDLVFKKVILDSSKKFVILGDIKISLNRIEKPEDGAALNLNQFQGLTKLSLSGGLVFLCLISLPVYASNLPSDIFPSADEKNSSEAGLLKTQGFSHAKSKNLYAPFGRIKTSKLLLSQLRCPGGPVPRVKR